MNLAAFMPADTSAFTSPFIEKVEAFIAEMPKATHARMDEIGADLFLKGMFDRKHYTSIAHRRAAMTRGLNKRVENSRRALAERTAMDAFIGPTTLRERNGHPF